MRSHIGSPDRYARLDSSPSAMENGGLVNGGLKGAAAAATSVAVRNLPGRRTAHNMSSSSLRKKSELTLVSKIRCRCLRDVVSNLQEVILGTKLSVLFLAIPLAITAQAYDYGKPWIFGLSLLGLTPLAERVSFLTEQIAYYTGPTVGGLLNATCGNATELIIAVLALSKNKISVVKYTLLGSILSNLLLVLGTSLFCGGIVNLNQEQKFDSRQADANVLLLLLGLSCHLLPLLLASSSTALVTSGVVSEPSISTLGLSRVSSIVMLVAYFAFLVFQLWTHRQLFEAEEDSDEVISTGAGGVGGGSSKDESHVIGFWSGFTWLVGMTIVIALLSEYVVATIEDASESWGLSIAFISVIMLPIVGNAAEHAGAIIFAFKNKLDITLGVALGSATQISMFVVPMCVVVSWVMGLKMDLKFSGFETGCLALSIVITAVALQDGSAHYMKGLVLLLCYIIIGAGFFVLKPPLPPSRPGLIILRMHALAQVHNAEQQQLICWPGFMSKS